jgi:hypothetical protein
VLQENSGEKMGIVDEMRAKAAQESVATRDWLEKERETMLLYGAPKSGKTFAYCSMIERTIKNGGKVWILNTDAGVSKTLKQYFGDELEKIKDKITYYLVTDMNNVDKVVKEILALSKENDLVVIDLMSDFWEMAQTKFIDDASGGDIVNYIVKASKDNKTFGLFSGQMWQYVRSLHNKVVSPFTGRTRCDVVAVCAQKELDVEKAITGKIKDKEYETAGARPAGEPRLAYQFNTIVYLGSVDKGKGHYFQIIGDRGGESSSNMVSFEKNFIEKFENERKKKYLR